jgi:hypothetical protein
MPDTPPGMRILLSFEFLGLGGTETYTVTVARELERLGHDTAIYTPGGGPMVESARAQGVRVLGREALPDACDAVIASDAATAHELAGRYREAFVVFVAHSVEHMLQAPPQLAECYGAVVVLNDRVRRAVQARAWHAPVVRLRQPIDRLRFSRLGPGRSSARTALVSSNYVTGPRLTLIEQACRNAGLELSRIGATNRATSTPELAIADADVVIGLGRSVLEAMAAGRAAYVYGNLGGDGWITPESYSMIEANGFAGTADERVVIDGDLLSDDLKRWNAAMGGLNRDLICAHHDVHEHAVALVDLARGERRRAPREVAPSEEMAHLVRLQWRSELRAVAGVREASSLRALLGDRERELAALKEQQRQTKGALAQAQAVRAEAEAALAYLRNTRRYRLACRVAAPLDSLRAAIGGG